MNAQKMIIALVIGVALAACSRVPSTSEGSSSQAIIRATTGDYYPLVRDFDPEYGIVCYRVRHGEGLSCVKVSDPVKNSGNTAFSAVSPANNTEY